MSLHSDYIGNDSFSLYFGCHSKMWVIVAYVEARETSTSEEIKFVVLLTEKRITSNKMKCGEVMICLDLVQQDEERYSSAKSKKKKKHRLYKPDFREFKAFCFKFVLVT